MLIAGYLHCRPSPAKSSVFAAFAGILFVLLLRGHKKRPRGMQKVPTTTPTPQRRHFMSPLPQQMTLIAFLNAVFQLSAIPDPSLQAPRHLKCTEVAPLGRQNSTEQN